MVFMARLACLALSYVVLLQATSVDALCKNNTLPKVDTKKQEEIAFNSPQPGKFEAAAIAKVIQGACYSPFHNPQYPVNGVGYPNGLDAAMNDDFAIMKNYVSVVRTYYSSYFGFSVAQAAANNGVKLFLGVYMTTDSWGPSQYTDAVTAVKTYPDTIAAILIGNENIAPNGPYSPNDISLKITEMRNRIRSETGRTVPIGTVQRAAEWLDGNQRNQMLALAANCDIIGVNIYPFFDANYRADGPLILLNAIWDNMVALYGPSKLRLTEIGYPTAGTAPSYAPKNIPSVANAKNFYSAFVNWNPSQGGKEAFWFMFFDRRPDDNTVQGELEKYFGFFTYQKRTKAPEFPVLLSALLAAGAPVATVTPAPTTPAPTTTRPPPATTTPAPTTTRPPPATTTPAPVTTRPPPATTTPAPTPPTTTTAPVTIYLAPANLPAKVCRARKIYK